jgi:hypothetical protein
MEKKLKRRANIREVIIDEEEETINKLVIHLTIKEKE